MIAFTPRFHIKDKAPPLNRRADVVDTGDGGDNHDILPGHDVGGCLQAQLIDQFVDLRFFLNISVGCGNISLGLVVIVVGDKVGDGVFREKVAHLLVKLAGEGFVVGDDQSRHLEVLDDICHRKGFS